MGTFTESRTGKKVKSAAVILLWLALWQLLALYLDNSILLAGPIEVLVYLERHMFSFSFWRTVGNSFFHIFIGFISAFLSAFFLGAAAAKISVIEDILSPFMQFVKSVPVASFVVLLLIWAGSSRLSVSVTFLMVFPVIYQNVLGGVKNTDRELLEMADVFGLSRWNRIFFLCRPALMPFLLSGCKSALGMSWKAGVAAEVIGTPDFSIGERIYMSKIYLDTAGVFAWTFVVILLSFFFEKLFLALLKAVGCAKVSPVPARGRFFPAGRGGKGEQEEDTGDIVIEGLTKRYGEKTVINNMTAAFRRGGIYALMGKSGCGKTTLFRILLGLTDYEGGKLAVPRGRCGAVFQENRLCPEEDPVTNVRMAAGGRTREETREILEEILPAGCLHQKVGQQSGGMMRRTAIARALLGDGEWLLLDEPFTGLDEATKKETIDFILKYRNGRTLLVATHHKEEAELLSADIVLWEGKGERI